MPCAWGAAPTESEVEAAYLYNFGRFARWPAKDRGQPFHICILGDDPFGGALDRIVANEKIDDRPLAVVRIKDASEFRSCSILYIGASEASHLEQDLSAVAGRPVMTVSDIDGFVQEGGTIEFVLQNDRVRFEVNLNAASKAGLPLNAQLLKVAVRVIGSQ